MIVDCISDLHGHYPKLEGGDLLIVAGDLTGRDEIEQYLEFNKWLSQQDYKRKIVIAGNHDGYCETGIPVETLPGEISTCVPVLADKAVYLCDSGTKFEGLKIWGSPWSLLFDGINPRCCAFTGSETELKNHFDKIPEDIDILITHSPPYRFLDTCADGRRVGSVNLHKMIIDKTRLPNLKLHVFGHIHEQGGRMIQTKTLKLVNASHVNEHYQPVNEPVRVIL